MRCTCCNVVLTPSECVRKFKGSGDFVDMCNKCLATISEDVEVVDGKATDEDTEYDDDYSE